MNTPIGRPAPAGHPDAGVPWHYGDPHAEQRALASGHGAVDLRNRDVVRVSGPDRLTWLHDLTTAHLTGLVAGESRLALILSPHGHVEHELHLVDDGSTTWISVEPGDGARLASYLDAMRFLLRVVVAEDPDFAVVWEPIGFGDPAAPSYLTPAEFAGTGSTPAGADDRGGAGKYVDHRPAFLPGREVVLPRADIAARVARSQAPAGTWAWEALRVAAAIPRLHHETDHRTLPHEVGWIGPAVHLQKGCYRGQETVARVHNLGHPPRRLALAHLDGSGELPLHGAEVLVAGRLVGFVGTAARHFELGPIATVILKRSTPVDAELVVATPSGPQNATQEVVIAP